MLVASKMENMEPQTASRSQSQTSTSRQAAVDDATPSFEKFGDVQGQASRRPWLSPRTRATRVPTMGVEQTAGRKSQTSQ